MTERERFEAWVSASPRECRIKRYPDDPGKHAWPGQYLEYPVQLAWDAWQAALESAKGEVND